MNIVNVKLENDFENSSPKIQDFYPYFETKKKKKYERGYYGNAH